VNCASYFYGKFIYLSDHNISERHNFLETSIIGVLDLEIESYQMARLFSWVFFPIFIALAIVQYISFYLYSGRFHPMAKILDGNDNSSEG
jgi:hypothetical protein